MSGERCDSGGELFLSTCLWVISRVAYHLEGGFPGGSKVKNLLDNSGDAGLISGSGRYPGGGNNNPLQYSCQGNPMARGTWWDTVHGVAKDMDI